MSEFVEHYGAAAYPSCELVTGMRLTQYFIAHRPLLRRIGISFGTRGNSPVNLLFNLTTADGRSLADRRIDASALVDNNYAVIDLDLPVRIGQVYAVNIVGNGRPGESVWVKWGPSKHFNNERLYMVDVNTNNNEMYCFMVYDDVTKEKPAEPPVRIIPDCPVASEVKPDDIVPTEVPKMPKTPVMEFESIKTEVKPAKTEDAVAADGEKIELVKGKVSVLVWHKNSSSLVEATLESIFAQTYKHIGVVLIEDGSAVKDRDALGMIYRKFNRRHEIKQIPVKNPKGQAKARNTGAPLADGEFLLFCDPGIILEPDFLAEMINSLHDKPEAGWAYSDYKKGDVVEASCKFDLKDSDKSRCHLTSLFRRRMFPGFEYHPKKTLEADLFERLAKRGIGGEWINLPLFIIPKGG